MSAGKHPSSDGLRKLADWLDQNDTGLSSHFVIGCALAEETPELFAWLVRETGANLETSYNGTVFADGKLFGISVGFYAAKAKVGAVRKVVREVDEFVIAGDE